MPRSPAERSSIDRMLGNYGLPGLDAGAGLMSALGFLVEDHDHFRNLVERCEPEERSSMYDSLKPYVRFQLHPLEWYVARSKEMADKEKLPTVAPDGSLTWPTDQPIPQVVTEEYAAQLCDQAMAQEAVNQLFASEVLTLTCRSCTKQAQFTGDTVNDCVVNARLEGWVHYTNANGVKVEICPECPAIRK